ncbi:Na+/H+ antiporter NhaA [Actinoallomurus iriomotensis]|uniref:Na(+)/H(+) antiporter NhaA n=1 Tax=Actinoallomurus iriomotensis TaxID=478107 RepID=A0A9W6RSJ1_9ACTN|nr:Na+/H+ antiporter NhaA [Actinoallomurus iriomotensis]GLY80865.1 Na(+)/H(+) antiporter NhaA 2 [Actinoallomurus iriomotensis]
MSEAGEAAERFSGRTAWALQLKTPLSEFLRTETGGAALLLTATVAALLWANVDSSSYESVWGTRLSIRLGGSGLSQDLREWVNTGLMTFFFFVVGLEARREFDMGELRDRRRLVLPLMAGVGGMIVPIAIFLAINVGGPSTRGWGAAMSTDTAFALGMLTLAAKNVPSRMRAYLLTVTVVDDLVALAVIAVFYSSHVRMMPLLVTLAVLVVVLILRVRGERHGIVYAALGIVAWVAMFESGIEPVVVGLVLGLLTYASPAARDDLQRASEMFRLFREQPTAELARTASDGLASAISPNERLQLLYHPWTSYVIVPIFALANAGVAISGGLLSHALTSPITLGILIAYIAGKPVGITGFSWLITRLTRGRIQVPVGWAAVVGGGAIAGIGFTVSLLIATLAFHGTQLEEAKLGILGSALVASVLTWAIFRVTRMLPKRLKLRALLGTADPIVDLAAPVDPDRDHIRGPSDAPVTVVEYGDYECPYCGQAEPVVRELLADFGDVRYVWRHLPLHDVHPEAQLAAEASEAAAVQGMFWDMHDRLFANQDRLRARDLLGHAEALGLDVDRFGVDLRRHLGAARVAEDLDSADLSGVSGTPTFFINGKRHYGAYDIETLSAAIRAARARAYLGSVS